MSRGGGRRGFHWPAFKSYRKEDRQKERKEENLERRGVTGETDMGTRREVVTHVQYTQTDTIRQTDGPLVPMVRLVPIEKHPIPMVLLVHMHLIKGT